MIDRFGRYAAAGALCLALATPTHALLGVGVHWGFDLTLDMPDVENEHLSVQQYIPSYSPEMLLDSVKSHYPLTAQQESIVDSIIAMARTGDVPLLSGQLPLAFSRVDLIRSPINFGGKAYLDIIPILDAIELSFNLGVWEYYGYLTYPGQNQDGIMDRVAALDLSDPASIAYEDILLMDTLDLTLEEFGLKFLWLDQTPFMKLQFDLTIRKNLVAKPSRTKILKIYAGGGPSVHFATPVLTDSLVMDVLATALEETGGDPEKIASLMNDDELTKQIVLRITEEALKPKWGMHIILGTHIKPPILPLGFYGDAKFIIPFGPYDERAQLKGYGLMFNLGVTLGL